MGERGVSFAAVEDLCVDNPPVACGLEPEAN